ncbi:hypothetical protein CVT25_000969 [Psilocybe cyanescens]|uniref:SWIM-type domain-containing protein n=1 Tax=Psilocybe cyanescens TaxID=93625 RepID=A0A409XBA0_PSICY|nr:hypothetical protein CVT25_000969 [Psilocybe cyanescens]
MGVENFWRQLKHNYLHNIAQPRLDHLVWILINRVTPAYLARSEILDNNYHLGQTQALTTYQKYFKKSWLVLAKQKISDKVYLTNVQDWTCSCGHQKYDCHHLCKHLVQSVDHPLIRFWCEVNRRHVLPLYLHPALVPKRTEAEGDGCCTSSPVGHYIDPTGNITDGDDCVWSGDPKILAGGGGYKDLAQKEKTTSTSVLGKRTATNATDDHLGTRLNNEFSGESGFDQPKKKVALTTTMLLGDIIDLTLSSSPPPEMIDVDMQEVHQTLCSSSPVEYGSGDEDELEIYRENILKRASAFDEAARILRAQVPVSKPIWLKSVVDRGLGNDVLTFVADITWHEGTSRKRDMTWADGKVFK